MNNFFDKYELYTDCQSIYCYPDSSVLKNKLGITSYDKLREAETDFVSARLFELELNPIQGELDKKHLYEIHRYLFKDLYDFAGESRKEDIAKGQTRFCVWNYIEEQGQYIFDNIGKIDITENAGIGDKIDFLAYVMSELNILHPFREGNGRAIREFVREYALKLNLKIGWNKVGKDRLLDAMVASVYDTTELKECLKLICSK